ncbi:DUF3024 domain-containing protein [Bradyrhizobium sp. 83012]|uniref:DUF3024 domain-containing protein n=1 Tax=Bradyrhizobium aeschynomenes TaxID=2734909 RepID=A0ABX2CNW2_9BRAD|nr:DUF3024 domain-containing protein [Bradyrhizobium aeschynomenes]NPU69884.1 DUF3024 domain-containing protein [Bradyrhizobium aeschynomenes]NPV25785.1 DUF3024 domain-containing protein [Bradyrhizobium aeschynomenes]
MVAAARQPSFVLPAHPNELDRRRIERALKSRKRYRYVEPLVVPVAEGYQVRSPCCSRNIDKDGGVIDVALLRHDPAKTMWKLFWRDHAKGNWELHSVHQRLTAAVDELNADPERIFWQ